MGTPQKPRQSISRADRNQDTPQLRPDRQEGAFETNDSFENASLYHNDWQTVATPYHSPRRPIDSDYPLSSSDLLTSQSPSQFSQYGATPFYVKQIRQARGDIGDLGRVHLMHDDDKNRIIDTPDNFFLSSIQSIFVRFFSNFVLSDYDDLDILEEDTELLEMKNEHQGVVELGHYGWKMVQYIQNQMASDARETETNQTFLRKTFEVNLLHVKKFAPDLLSAIINQPADAVCEVDLALRHKYLEVAQIMEGDPDAPPTLDISEAPRVRFFNNPEMDSLRHLGPDKINKLVCLQGLIIQCSEIIPEVAMAAFRCTGQKRVGVDQFEPCEHEVYEQVIEGEVSEPQLCPNCGSRKAYELWHSMCHFSSKQLIKISELAESIMNGESPQSISIYVYDDLIDLYKPGDRIELTGVFKASGVRINPRLRNLHSVFRTYIDCLHMRKEGKQRLRVADGESKGTGILRRAEDGMLDEIDLGVANIRKSFSKELIAEIIELSQRKDIYDLLVQSLAPSIYGKEDIKKGLLCQLFGGTRNKSKGLGGVRSDLHILLCGDPSTAKSQLLQYIHNMCPRGIFTSGKGSSSVGLTAAVLKDPDTKEFFLQGGAVVLSDLGICCIDEFDKMDESARCTLHEVMEQQTVTIAKAGIVATLNARTGILASANPIHSRYDRRKAVVENINLPPSLFSRFDLIYLVLDTPTVDEDRQLAERLCESFCSDPSESQSSTPKINSTLLSQYISYARATCNPKLNKESCRALVEEYCKIRHNESSNKKMASASPRQLEALIRLSQALAKMRLSNEVTPVDTAEAVRLIRVATYQTLIDPITGRIDFDQVNLGQTARQRAALEELKKRLIENLHNKSLTKEQILVNLQESLKIADQNSKDASFAHRRQFDEVLTNLEHEGLVVKSKDGKYMLSGASTLKI